MLLKKNFYPSDYFYPPCPLVSFNTLLADCTVLSPLAPRLYLLDAEIASDHEALREAGITAVVIVNLTPEDFGCRDAGFKVHHVPIQDCQPFDPVLITEFLK